MKIQSPWMGRVKGSAGNMTGSKVYDKNVLRAKAFEVSNPNTIAQQTERSFFAQVANTVQQFSKQTLRNLFPMKPKSMSRRNALTAQLTKLIMVSQGKKYLNFTDIFTLGNAPTMQIPVVEIANNQADADISWDTSTLNLPAIANNYAIFMVINITKGTIYFPSSDYSVIEGNGSFQLPEGTELNDELQCVLFVGAKKQGTFERDVNINDMEVLYRPAGY